MSATAFQRMRRLQAEKAKEQEELAAEVDINQLKVTELRAMLDILGIEYNPKAKKEELIELLKSSEDEEPKQEETDNDITPENNETGDNQSETTNNEEGAE